MKDTSLVQTMMSSADATKELMNGSIMSSVVANILISGSLSQIMGMINSLQLVFHLPIMSIIAPANIITMFQILIPVVMFDVMESMDFFSDMFPNSEEDMMESSE